MDCISPYNNAGQWPCVTQWGLFCQWQKCSQWTVVSEQVKFVQIFVGVSSVPSRLLVWSFSRWARLTVWQRDDVHPRHDRPTLYRPDTSTFVRSMVSPRMSSHQACRPAAWTIGPLLWYARSNRCLDHQASWVSGHAATKTWVCLSGRQRSKPSSCHHVCCRILSAHCLVMGASLCATRLTLSSFISSSMRRSRVCERPRLTCHRRRVTIKSSTSATTLLQLQTVTVEDIERVRKRCLKIIYLGLRKLTIN